MSYKLPFPPPSRCPEIGADGQVDGGMNGWKTKVRMGEAGRDALTEPEDKEAAWDCGCVLARETQRRTMMKIHCSFLAAIYLH